MAINTELLNLLLQAKPQTAPTAMDTTPIPVGLNVPSPGGEVTADQILAAVAAMKPPEGGAPMGVNTTQDEFDAMVNRAFSPSLTTVPAKQPEATPQTVMEYKLQEQAAGRVPEFTNVQGATGYQIPNTYGENTQGNISGNMSIIGKGDGLTPKAEAYIPELSAKAIRDYIPQGATDLDKYNDLQLKLTDFSGMVSNAALDYADSMRNPAVDRLEQLAQMQFSRKNYEGYNETQAQLRMIETKRQADINQHKDKLFSGHLNALEHQNTQLEILKQRANLVLTGQAAEAQYQFKTGKIREENRELVNTLSVINNTKPLTEHQRIEAGTDNLARRHFATAIQNGYVKSINDVLIYEAPVDKKGGTIPTMKDNVEGWKRYATRHIKDPAKIDLIAGVADDTLATYNQGARAYLADTETMKALKTTISDAKDLAAAKALGAKQAGINAVRATQSNKIANILHAKMDVIVPETHFSAILGGRTGKDLDTLTTAAKNLRKQSKGMDLGDAYRQAGLALKDDPSSPLYGMSTSELNILMKRAKPLLLDQLDDALEGTGLIPYERDLGSLGLDIVDSGWRKLDVVKGWDEQARKQDYMQSLK